MAQKDVLVKHVHGNVYDAFWGLGWKNWTRFLFRRGELIYIKGQFINAEDKNLLRTEVKAVNEEIAKETNALEVAVFETGN